MDASLLLSIVAPGSVEARIGRVQAALFADHGLVSAAALPPLIPVAFLSESARAAELLRDLERGARAPWRIRTAGAAWEGGFLYLAVSSGGLWSSLREGARSRAAALESGLFPVFEGFFAGCGDAAPGLRHLIRPVVPDLSFTSGSLAVIAIRSPRGTGEWWRDAAWEIIDQRPLRGRRVE